MTIRIRQLWQPCVVESRSDFVRCQAIGQVELRCVNMVAHGRRYGAIEGFGKVHAIIGRSNEPLKGVLLLVSFHQVADLTEHFPNENLTRRDGRGRHHTRVQRQRVADEDELSSSGNKQPARPIGAGVFIERHRIGFTCVDLPGEPRGES